MCGELLVHGCIRWHHPSGGGDDVSAGLAISHVPKSVIYDSK
jgi:hypothetical protein